MKEKTEYYSCNYLLTLKDINRNLPDIYISDGNRTAGKTFSWKCHLVNSYFKNNDINQFIVLYRNRYELKNISESFFTDIERVKFKGHVMTDEPLLDGALRQLLMDGETCGYAVPLSMASKLRKASALFSRVKHMFFDEYQDEENKYLTEEVSKLMSLHTTVARGDGEQHRRVPLYMASNTVSVLNPYYTALGITKRLKSDTKFLRGEGWVYERTFNQNAASAFEEASFNRAFKTNRYSNFASQNVYLNDNMSLVEKPSGYSNYFLSIKYNSEWFNFRKYDSVMYASRGYDASYPVKICFNVNDVTDDRTLMIGKSNYLIDILRTWFNQGKMRFQDLECKNMAFDLLSFL